MNLSKGFRPVEKVKPETLHCSGSVIAERTRLDHIVLSDVFVLEMSSHSDLPLKSPVAYGTVIRQSF